MEFRSSSLPLAKMLRSITFEHVQMLSLEIRGWLPHPALISPAKQLVVAFARSFLNFFMADQQQKFSQDPPIYKHLSPKTQAFLRASAPQREEAARLAGDTMSNEQT